MALFREQRGGKTSAGAYTRRLGGRYRSPTLGVVQSCPARREMRSLKDNGTETGSASETPTLAAARAIPFAGRSLRWHFACSDHALSKYVVIREGRIRRGRECGLQDFLRSGGGTLASLVCIANSGGSATTSASTSVARPRRLRKRLALFRKRRWRETAFSSRSSVVGNRPRPAIVDLVPTRDPSQKIRPMIARARSRIPVAYRAPALVQVQIHQRGFGVKRKTACLYIPEPNRSHYAGGELC